MTGCRPQRPHASPPHKMNIADPLTVFTTWAAPSAIPLRDWPARGRRSPWRPVRGRAGPLGCVHLESPVVGALKALKIGRRYYRYAKHRSRPQAVVGSGSDRDGRTTRSPGGRGPGDDSQTSGAWRRSDDGGRAGRIDNRTIAAESPGPIRELQSATVIHYQLALCATPPGQADTHSSRLNSEQGVSLPDPLRGGGRRAPDLRGRSAPSSSPPTDERVRTLFGQRVAELLR